ncbi:tripartite tricarboxylate transporter TctB family protein [Xanthobacteraceae bacterium Astr-EGSB]|uniref:tripartite tricarboxylate transporter TctB family protein n=1 Tax=Astrobacterium formosum TaxID=3069710 RepID=UPI0027B72699|nr:tripartite tricarboxylate transporter TctB family protein [Xanthobacteraceae bacterium Astr-EGSB]
MKIAMLPVNATLGGAGLVVVAAYVYGTIQIPELQSGDPLGPRVFPFGLAVLLAICSVLLACQDLRAVKKSSASDKQAANDGATDLRLVAGIVCGVAFYYSVLEVVGFALATSGFLLGSMLYFHRESPVTAIITALAFGPAAYYLFGKLLEVQLPAGLFGI